jgi:hypothetical protein
VVTASTEWALRNSLTTGGADTTFSLGTRPTVPLTGDWDGDGTRTAGYYSGGTFHLRNTNIAGADDVTFTFGNARGFPVAGDFDGDGTDDVAVFFDGTWEIRLSTGATSTVKYGSGMWPNVVPVAGDWDGDGTDGIGYYCYNATVCPAGTWNLRHTATAGQPDLSFTYNPGTNPYPVVGDWDADGTDTVGVKAGATWMLNNADDASTPEVTFDFGAAGDFPVVWKG